MPAVRSSAHTPAKLYEGRGFCRVRYKRRDRASSCPPAPLLQAGKEKNLVVYTTNQAAKASGSLGKLACRQTGLEDWEKSAAVGNLTPSVPVGRASFTLRRDQRERYCYPPTCPQPKTRFSGQAAVSQQAAEWALSRPRMRRAKRGEPLQHKPTKTLHFHL